KAPPSPTLHSLIQIHSISRPYTVYRQSIRDAHVVYMCPEEILTELIIIPSISKPSPHTRERMITSCSASNFDRFPPIHDTKRQGSPVDPLTTVQVFAREQDPDASTNQVPPNHKQQTNSIWGGIIKER